MTLPERQGLYDPRHEHDSCGVAFVVHSKGVKSHEIVRQGLQILINLIDNAIKFSKDSAERTVLLRVAQVGDECRISVRDFGPGIPPKEMKKIFERFYRGNNESTRATRGTGIGLALVKMLVDGMDAKVEVENRDPGAEFSLILKTQTTRR